MRKLSARSLAGQFLVFQVLVVAVVLSAVAAVSVAQSTREFRDVRGQRMIAVAENLASTPIVRDRYADPFAAQFLAPDVDRAIALSGAAAGRPHRSRRCGPCVLGTVPGGPSRRLRREPRDEGRAWSGDLDVDGTHSLVGQVPILSTDGAVMAVVSVSEPYPSVWQLLSGAGERLLVYLGLGAALGLAASWILSRRIKRHTRGLEVAEIAGLADHREALLHSIREGVVAVNTKGVITLLNDSAQELLGVTAGAVGRARRFRRSRPGRRGIPAVRRRRSGTSSSPRARGCSRSTGGRPARGANGSVRSPRCATAPNWPRCRVSCHPTRA